MARMHHHLVDEEASQSLCRISQVVWHCPFCVGRVVACTCDLVKMQVDVGEGGGEAGETSTWRKKL